MITWQEWGYIIGGYLSGSVLYSYLLPKALKGIDITAESRMEIREQRMHLPVWVYQSVSWYFAWNF